MSCFCYFCCCSAPSIGIGWDWKLSSTEASASPASCHPPPPHNESGMMSRSTSLSTSSTSTLREHVEHTYYVFIRLLLPGCPSFVVFTVSHRLLLLPQIVCSVALSDCLGKNVSLHSFSVSIVMSCQSCLLSNDDDDPLQLGWYRWYHKRTSRDQCDVVHYYDDVLCGVSGLPRRTCTYVNCRRVREKNSGVYCSASCWQIWSITIIMGLDELESVTYLTPPTADSLTDWLSVSLDELCIWTY